MLEIFHQKNVKKKKRIASLKVKIQNPVMSQKFDCVKGKVKSDTGEFLDVGKSSVPPCLYGHLP